jgi:tRNA(His) guanylyltransferase
MANCKYAYVRAFEEATNAILLPDCFVVVRVDGQSFRRLSRAAGFQKPNDKHCCDLMVRAAQSVMKRFSPDVGLAYGQSDEFSFVFRRKSNCFNRRINKFVSLVPSVFSSAFARNWSQFFPDAILDEDQAFDGRAVMYPSTDVLRDYLSWRQVDCHINNLYNCTFHALTGHFVRHLEQQASPDQTPVVVTQPLAVYSDPDFVPMSPQQATQRLDGTVSSDKHEILFSQFGVNYNNELQQFRKGSVILLSQDQVVRNREETKVRVKRDKSESPSSSRVCDTRVLHTDIIGDKFWIDNKYILDYLNN